MTQEQKEKQEINKAWLGIFVVLGSLFWRPFFGGSFFYCWRWVKYVVGIAIVLSMYYLKNTLDWNNWRMYAVCVSFMYHFAKSHGDYFKVNDTSPDEARIKWIDWILKKLFKEKDYYTFKWNALGLLIRYVYTSIFVCLAIPNFLFIFAGIGTAFVYCLCAKLAPTGYYTKIAEYMSSLVNFFLLYLCL